MKNLTLAIDEELLLTARKLALEKRTTVNQLVREFLQSLVEDDGRRHAALSRLFKRMGSGVFEVGNTSWKRDELHED